MYPADQQTQTLPDQQGKRLLSQRCSIESVHFLHPQIPIKGLVVKVPGQIQPVLSVPKGTGLLYRSRVYMETVFHRGAIENQSHLRTGRQSVCLDHNCVSSSCVYVSCGSSVICRENFKKQPVI